MTDLSTSPRPQTLAPPGSLDLTKPVQTRDGLAVRILCTDGPCKDYPVIGFAEADGRAMQWAIDGREMLNDHGDNLDLVNVPERVIEWFGFQCGSHMSVPISDRGHIFESWPFHLRITWTDGVPKADIFEAGEPE